MQTTEKSSAIGIVTIEYDINGIITNATFAPTMVVELDETLYKQLENIENTNDHVALQYRADVIFATWFSKTNEIELADRSQWEISSKTLECLKHPSGKVKKCVIEYSFSKKDPDDLKQVRFGL